MRAEDIAVELARRLQAKRIGREWRAVCPCHADQHPSLDFHAEADRVMFTCRAGCPSADVYAAIRSAHPDLFVVEKDGTRQEWLIHDERGELVAVHVRYRRPDGSKGYAWRQPDGTKGLGGRRAADLPLYGLGDLQRAVADAEGDDAPTVVVCEGERATDAALALGLVAVGTVTGASSCPSDEPLRVLSGSRVILWPDADDPGRQHMSRIAGRLQHLGVEVAGQIAVPDARPGDDAADFPGDRDDALRLVRPLGDPDEPRVSGVRLVSVADAVSQALADLERFSSGDTSRLVPSGIKSLDHALHGGFRRGTVALVGAPTGTGKTTLAAIIAAAAGDAGGCLFVSPEMSASELVERDLVRVSGVGRARRAPWRLPEHRAAAVAAHATAADSLRQCRNVLLLDEPGAGMEAVTLAAAEARRRLPRLSALVLDYAQVLGATDPRTPRYVQVGGVGSSAVELARRLDVSVILTTQVNTVKGDDGAGYAVRESQMLEHVASLVMFMTVAWDEDPRSGRREVRSCRLRATKHRHGPLFTLNLAYEPELFRIGDLEAS